MYFLLNVCFISFTIFTLLLQEYKARKQERLLKKLSKNLQAEIQKASSVTTKGNKQDFNEMIREIAGTT